MNHKRILSQSVLFLVASLSLLLVGWQLRSARRALAASAHAALPALQGAAAVEHLKQQGLYASLNEAMTAAQYGIKPVPEAQRSTNGGAYLANNPAQQLRASFAADGLELQATAQAWRLGMKLRSIGYGARQTPIAPGTLSAQANRIEYAHPLANQSALKEWYVNTPSGLEQGFTLAEPPGERRAGEPLRLALALASDLHAQTAADGQAVEFWDAAGNRVLRYDKLAAWDARGQALTARMSVKGKELRLEVDDAAAFYPVTIDPNFSQQAYLKASNTEQNDNFGISVAVSGDTVVVGAFGEDSNSTGVNGDGTNNFGVNSGAAYVFVRSGVTWSQQAYLKASNTGSSDQFGISVAVAGDTVVVGANGEASNATGVNGNQADNSASQSGAAYVFVRNAGVWSQQAYLKASNTGAADFFGISVAVAGDTVVVGANMEDSNATGVNGNQADNSANDSGAAYVFVRSGVTWSQQAYLKASNTFNGDNFGRSVAVADDTVVVGAFQEDSNATGVNGNQADNSASSSGAAYVFVRSAGAWSQQAYLKASNTGSSDQFGRSVAVAGDTVVVGAFSEDSNATGVNGNQADNSAADSGAAYVFVRSAGVWSQQAYLKASNTGAFDEFGQSVAVAGDTVVVGAYHEDSNATGVNGNQADNSASNSGAVYTFFAPPIVVNSLADGAPANDGQCTLREALINANNDNQSGSTDCAAGAAGLDTVQFNLGAGTPTINLTSALPTITGPVLINGATGGATRVELNGTGAGAATGLSVTAGGSTIRNLVINRFGMHGLLLQTGGGNTVQGCLIGTNAAGTAAGPGNTATGVVVNNSANNLIGGASTNERNVISGNNAGVSLVDTGATGNLVRGNIIGLDVGASVAIANATQGVTINGAPNNTIGSAAPGALNVIAGNGGDGILVTTAAATGNTVQGNLIGTNVFDAGTLGNAGTGIRVLNAPNNIIGGTAAGARNIISRNGEIGVRLDSSGSTGNQVLGNLIGTNLAGTAALGNLNTGVLVISAPNNIIGGTATGAGNLISGNSGSGISISAANGNQVLGNVIGLNTTGGTALPNQQHGIIIGASAGTIIGGTSASARNVISGNTRHGVLIDNVSSNTQVLGNYIGLDVTGALDLGNLENGIEIFQSTGSLIGGTAAGARNVISGNNQLGVRIATNASNNNQILGNYIGTNAAGTAAIANTLGGVTVESPNNTIGGTAAGARNVISGNGANGVALSGASATNNQVQGNYIGTNATGSAALANTTEGVVLNGAVNNTIGGTAAGARNVIAGNGNDGVLLNAGATGNQVLGNFIGTNAAGSAIITNSGDGVDIQGGANANAIGGTTTTARNVIAGSGGNGVQFANSGTQNNQVLGNYIGTDVNGTTALGNFGNGVGISDAAANNTIGGTAAGASNLISGNAQNGVAIVGALTANNLVQRNNIGVNVLGTGALANGFSGVLLSATSGNTIGGTAAGAGNVLSGNGNRGLEISGTTASGNTVQGNYIGLNAAGTSAISNANSGLRIDSAPNNLIGGTTTSARNVISGNPNNGIHIVGATATGNQVQGNFIGTNAAGNAGVGNGQEGIQLDTSANNNVIGGTAAGAGNTIAFNDRGLVMLTAAAVGNRVVGNLFFSNTRQAIDLNQDAVTANDTGDADSGPNRLQNFPVLNFVTNAGALGGMLDSLPANTAYPVRIEFFANTACDTSGNGEGEVFLGFVSLAATGAFTFNFTPIVSKPFITATATDNNGNTSEFSACRQVGDAPAQTLTVNTLADTVAADGFCSLREAMQAANTNAVVNECNAGVPGLDNIVFALGAGTPSIAVTGTALPTITEPLMIDGATGGATRIELNGAGAGAAANGLTITGGGTTLKSLVINRFSDVGIFIQPLGGNTIQNCYIGTDANGTADFGNTGSGIFINVAPNNVIDGNLISGNNGHGLLISGAAAAGNQILGNIIGLNAAGTAALANSGDGVRLNGAPNNIIGGTTVGARNFISGNLLQGVEIFGAAATGNQVLGNHIGTDLTGGVDLGNIGDGVFIDQAPNNVVGGTVSGARNIISGNNDDGVQIANAGATGNQVLGNFIGVRANGLEALGNGLAGVLVSNASNNTIGGTATAARNVISGNTSFGIFFNGGGATINQVLGNYIGTNAAGTAALPNASGVSIQSGATNNTVGGAAAGAGNVISGNNVAGVLISGAAVTGNQVHGNLIGTNAAGMAALANAVGVRIDMASGNTIGGTVAGARNVISGNVTGVELRNGTAPGNTVQGNFIGTTPSGTAALGNMANGVSVTSGARNNTIGGMAAGAGNLIAFNTGAGVSVSDATSTGNSVLANRIHSNGALGLDLGTAGLTQNDLGDADTGPNGLQNFPLLTAVATTLTATTFQGTLNSTAATTFRIEFFSNPACDPSGNGEGQVLLGFTEVTTNASGNATISITQPVVITPGHFVTATATNLTTNDTSEFSPCVCSFGFTPPTAAFTAMAGTGMFTITTAPTCSWTVASSVPWITLTGNLAGTGNGVVTYSVQANPQTTLRTGTINVTGPALPPPNQATPIAPNQVIVTQAGGTGSLIEDESFNQPTFPPPGWVEVDGGTGSGQQASWVNSNTAPCAPPVIGPPFISTFALVDANCADPGIALDEQILTPPFNATGMGAVFVEFFNQYHASPGTTGDVDVSTNGGLSWTNVLRMTTDDGVGTPTTKLLNLSPFIGLNAPNVIVRLHYYGTSPPRPARPTAQMTRRGRRSPTGELFAYWAVDFSIYGFSINPASNAFPAAGGTGSVNVTAPPKRAWTAQCNVPWLSAAPPNGTGNATVNYTVQANPATTGRTGTCTVAGNIFTVNQAGTSCAPLTINPATLPNGMPGTSYNQTLTATGGTAPYTFAVTGGTLPNGLTLASTGALTGTPTTTGTFNFTVAATDANTCTSTPRVYTVLVTGNGLQFYPLAAPVRALETRAPFSGCVNPGAPINANATFTLAVRTGCTGIPAQAVAVTGNVTVVPGAAGGYLTLFPSSTTQPIVANSNFKPGEVTNNVFTTGLGAGDGAFKIFASATTEVIVDITGYYAPPAANGLYFHPLSEPVRLLETRAGQPIGCVKPGAPLLGGADFEIQGRAPVAAPCNVIPAAAQVLVGNATSVFAASGGFLTIFPSDAARPLIASSNYAGADVINGPFAVKLGADGKFKVFTSQTTDLVIDILGYYSAEATDANGVGLLFNPLDKPVRLLETRPDPGFPLTGCYRPNAKITGGTAGIRTQQSWGTCEGLTIPTTARAIIGNATVVNVEGAGFMTFYPGNVATAPTVATSNYPAPVVFGYNRHFIVGVGPADGTFKILTQFTTDLIVDVAGYFAP